MPSTYTLISSNVLSTSADSVTFSAIPSTYTDLVLRMSPKHGTSGVTSTIQILLNDNSSNVYSRTAIYANGSSIGSVSSSNSTAITGARTGVYFSSIELYLPSYTSASNKALSLISMVEYDDASTNEMFVSEGLFRSTSTITSISLTTPGTNFVSGSSFYLYGIKNS